MRSHLDPTWRCRCELQDRQRGQVLKGPLVHILLQRKLKCCWCATKCFRGTVAGAHPPRLAFPALTECCCFVSVLQMEVVSTFKRSGSFQGAVRRRSSVLSQLHDVNTISTPSHVALSTATANTSPAPGSEFAECMYTQTHTSTC